MRDEVIAEQMEQVPTSSKGILQRAYDGKGSPRQAIKAFCLHCVGYVRADVTACTGFSCPLWAWRPYQDGEDAPEAAEAAGETS